MWTDRYGEGKQYTITIFITNALKSETYMHLIRMSPHIPYATFTFWSYESFTKKELYSG